VTLVLVAALGNMGPWVRVAARGPAAGVANANYWTNVGLWIGLSVAFIITLVNAVQEVRRLLRSPVTCGPSPKSANSTV